MLSQRQILLSHDPLLISLAVAICLLGSFITIVLYRRGRFAFGESRIGWMVLAGFAAGAVIWTTHFVAMLAFNPGTPLAYSPVMTGASFFTAVAGAIAGLAIAARGDKVLGLIGGAIVGLGAGAMHLSSVTGLEIAGTIAWDDNLIIIGVVTGALLSALAFSFAVSGRKAMPVTAPLLLAASILALHFCFKASMRIELHPELRLHGQVIDATVLGYFVTAMIMLLVGTGLGAAMIARGVSREARAQLRNVADAAVEGLVLTDGAKVLDINQSFRDLIGAEAAKHLIGTSIWDIFVDPTDRPEGRFEALLKAPAGPIPVEVIVRASPANGADRHVLAVRDLRERNEAEQRIRYLAHNDILTGLPNRASFAERLEEDLSRQRLQAGGQLAVMVLDLDHFKEINDVHGHGAGDTVLKGVASRLKGVLEGKDFAARLGGDEFVILQDSRDQPAAAGALADRILLALSRPFELEGQRFQIGATMGVAVFPRDGDDGGKLLANADLALYRAKAHGRSRASFFTAEMDEAVRERRILALELKDAIENDRLQVYYQAQATISDGEIVGFEALARWDHPVRGFIPPTEFIAIAEESDLILLLGEWMLRAVCREAAAWDRPYRVAVNVSAVQFKKANLPELIHGILMETGMPANRLELEITETALVGDLQRALDILRRIKALGVAIAMDDFGTGYSSLSTLQAFPFDKIKIDKSFVDKIGSRQQASVIVTAVLGLGRSLEIPVLAEGVETDMQRSFLTAENCEQAQGFLFGRPVSIDGIRHIVFQPPVGTAVPAAVPETKTPTLQDLPAALPPVPRRAAVA